MNGKTFSLATIHVRTARPYDVSCGENARLSLASALQSAGVKKALVISDDVVFPLYGSELTASLHSAGIDAVSFVFPHGENHKNLETYESVLSFASEHGLSRADAFVALGGGVVSDLAGFAAATYLRGVRYYVIPTTYLGALDASVGGKTGVNKNGKNRVGAFWQPSGVFTDTAVLAALPASEFYKTGEAVKYALLSREAFDAFPKNVTPSALTPFLAACIRYKADVVSKDEFDRNPTEDGRILLNLGHTFAHALEAASSYRISHGVAVAEGLKRLLVSAERRGNITAKTRDELLNGFATFFPDLSVEKDALLPFFPLDKKRDGDDLLIVDFYGVGNCKPVRVPIKDVWGYFS